MTSRENQEPPVKTMADYAMPMEQLDFGCLDASRQNVAYVLRRHLFLL